MPKYWGKQIFEHGRFLEVGQKQKTEKKEREKERKRAKVGDNNGQATHGARKHAWCPQAAWAKKKKEEEKKRERAKIGNNNGQLRIATPPHVAQAKPSGPTFMNYLKFH